MLFKSIFRVISIIFIIVFFQLSGENLNDKFKLELIAQNEYEAGQPVIVNIRITNNTGADILLVHDQDGSLHKFRYPYLCYEILNENNAPVKILQPIDKVVNPLSSKAFFTLKSGESTDFYEDGFDLSRFYGLKEGFYNIICCYSTDYQKESQWYGAYADDYWNSKYENSFWLERKPDIENCSKLIKNVPALNLRSALVKITIRKGVYITKEKALAIAKRVCLEEKWKWDDSKISINDEGSEWKINTNKNSLGMNGIINIDKRTGEVLSKFMTGP